MITPRSALKFDLFAEASRKRKIGEAGDPLQTIAQHIDFAERAALIDGIVERRDARKGGRPAYPTEVMVRVLVLKRLYNLSDEQMESVAGPHELCMRCPAQHGPQAGSGRV